MKRCGHVSGINECGATENVRQYSNGPRCPLHTPAAVAGRPEPTGRYCAPARCCCGNPACPAYGTYDRADDPIHATVHDLRAVASGRRVAGSSRRRQHAADDYEEASRG